MKTRYTPGAWTLNLVQRWPFGVEVVSETGRLIHCEDAVCHSTVQKTRADNEAGKGFGKESSEAAATVAEQDAIAHLIAAAPKLLSSNERLLSNFRLLLASKPVRDAAETIAEAEHAIAAATGETK